MSSSFANILPAFNKFVPRFINFISQRSFMPAHSRELFFSIPCVPQRSTIKLALFAVEDGRKNKIKKSIFCSYQHYYATIALTKRQLIPWRIPIRTPTSSPEHNDLYRQSLLNPKNIPRRWWWFCGKKERIFYFLPRASKRANERTNERGTATDFLFAYRLCINIYAGRGAVYIYAQASKCIPSVVELRKGRRREGEELGWKKPETRLIVTLSVRRTISLWKLVVNPPLAC